MTKRRSRFVCQNCGAVASRWSGHCDSCDTWNSFCEESDTSSGPGRKPSKGRVITLSGLSGQANEVPRTASGIVELDRVLGGGLVKGSAILVGGDPGIGKSTLLIQAASAISQSGGHTVYISGEEAIGQVQLRAQRLGLSAAPVSLGAETNVENIIATLDAGPPSKLVIIDSIQTMWTETVESAPGTVGQVRASAQMMIRFAKQSDSAVILVGHVTKDGQIAGPRVVEHMVDAVLYFEGDAAHQFRILRAVKNRFGPTDEIGVFEMTGGGLFEIANPSAFFLGERDTAQPGIAVLAGMEGTRPLLVEVQALLAPSPFGTPRRAVIGWDSQRLAMILAVLEARCGLKFGTKDIYLNIAGGMRIQEPAADLAAAAAIISSLANKALPANHVYFGEIGLSGTIRKVAHSAARLREAKKLGFTSAIGPLSPDLQDGGAALDFKQIETLFAFVAHIAKQNEPDQI